MAAISVPTGTGNVQIGGGMPITGILAVETTGSASASLSLHDGTGTGDPIVFVYNLAEGACAFVPVVHEVVNGLFLQRVSGSTQLVIYTRDLS